MAEWGKVSTVHYVRQLAGIYLPKNPTAERNPSAAAEGKGDFFDGFH